MTESWFNPDPNDWMTQPSLYSRPVAKSNPVYYPVQPPTSAPAAVTVLEAEPEGNPYAPYMTPAAEAPYPASEPTAVGGALVTSLRERPFQWDQIASNLARGGGASREKRSPMQELGAGIRSALSADTGVARAADMRVAEILEAKDERSRLAAEAAEAQRVTANAVLADKTLTPDQRAFFFANPNEYRGFKVKTFEPPKPPNPTRDMTNYRFYAGQELEAGRAPMPFREWVATAGASASTGTERIAAELMAEAVASGRPIPFSEALRRAQRAPTDERDRMTRERLALDAARSDSAYDFEPEDVLARWRDFYGLSSAVPTYGAAAAPPARSGNSASSSRPASIPPRPAGVPEGAAYSPDMDLWYGPDQQFYDAAGRVTTPPPGVQ